MPLVMPKVSAKVSHRLASKLRPSPISGRGYFILEEAMLAVLLSSCMMPGQPRGSHKQMKCKNLL